MNIKLHLKRMSGNNHYEYNAVECVSLRDKGVQCNIKQSVRPNVLSAIQSNYKDWTIFIVSMIISGFILYVDIQSIEKINNINKFNKHECASWKPALFCSYSNWTYINDKFIATVHTQTPELNGTIHCKKVDCITDQSKYCYYRDSTFINKKSCKKPIDVNILLGLSITMISLFIITNTWWILTKTESAIVASVLTGAFSIIFSIAPIIQYYK